MTGNELKQFRKSLGWTQGQLGEYLGTTRVSIGACERRGEQQVPRSRAINLACQQKIIADVICSEFLPALRRAKDYVESECYVYSSRSCSPNATPDDKAMSKKLTDLNHEMDNALESVIKILSRSNI